MEDLLFRVSKVKANTATEKAFSLLELANAFKTQASDDDLTAIATAILAKEEPKVSNVSDIKSKLKQIEIDTKKITFADGILSVKNEILSEDAVRLLNPENNYKISVLKAGVTPTVIAKIEISKDGKAMLTPISK